MMTTVVNNKVSRSANKRVAVFGAGIAGLSAAHEFAKLDYDVSVYEANSEAGGFFRSARMKNDDGMPSEYSWHGIGPWYHNVFDVMKQIPFDKSGNVYAKALSGPITFGVVPDKVGASFDGSNVFNYSKSFRMTPLDKLALGWVMLKTWTSNRRTNDNYSRLNAAAYWKPYMSDKGWKTWRATFGPWIGSDWANASLHHVGLFFRRNMFAGPTDAHESNKRNGPWTHNSNDGWRLLRGPSNEWWFDKWVSHLHNNGVKFSWNAPLQKLEYDGTTITSAQLASGKKVHADYFVLATTPFAAVDILKQTPKLAKLDQLNLFAPLTRDGPHTQVSFRIAFADKIAWDRPRSAVIIADSEYNITLFAQEQVWGSKVSLGKGIKSLWTGTACVSNTPGKLFNKPLDKCTKQEFISEVTTQIFRCDGLDKMIRGSNKGKPLSKFPILKIEVWHEWLFSPKGIKPAQPKWVTTYNTQPFLPTQTTPVANLLLAGAHTKTQADVWSIEGAVESGRRAAGVVEPGVKVIPQYKPPVLKFMASLDDMLFTVGGPQLMNLLGAGFSIAIVFLIFELLR